LADSPVGDGRAPEHFCDRPLQIPGYFRQVRFIARGGSGDAQRRAYALLQTGVASAQRGDLSGAIALWNEAKTLFGQVEDLRGVRQRMLNPADRNVVLTSLVTLSRDNRAVCFMRMATMLADSAATAALPLYQQAFALFDKAGNEEGKAAAAEGIASVSGGAAQG
jgi:hypothetical protein